MVVYSPSRYGSKGETGEGTGGNRRAGVVARNGIGESIGGRVSEESHVGDVRGVGTPSTVMMVVREGKGACEDDENRRLCF